MNGYYTVQWSSKMRMRESCALRCNFNVSSCFGFVIALKISSEFDL